MSTTDDLIADAVDILGADVVAKVQDAMAAEMVAHPPTRQELDHVGAILAKVLDPPARPVSTRQAA